MSNTRSPSRSSPVLGGHPKAISVPRVPHPPRLQHSPSLPNIWFPQNSGRTMQEKEKGNQDSMDRPSAPSSPKNKHPASVAVKEPQMRHVKYASIDPAYRKPQGAKTHTRRRTERDQPHSLLTPPLTPSSSIRTTASSDSAASVGLQANGDSNENPSEEILDSDTESTRILLFENASQNITVASLEAAIGDAFASVATEKNAAGEATPSSAPREVLKGINPRLHRDEGILLVVFFDVREAKHASDLIESKQFDGYLKKYIGDSDGGEDQSTGLSARLITLEELSKIIGHSRFLDGIEGAFSLKVQKLYHKESDDVRTPTEHDAPLETEHQDDGTKTEHAHGSSATRGGINSAILQTVLKSYGSVRFFKFIQEEVDQYGAISIIYRVEYHDLRDAEASYQELKDQRIFGMRITHIDGNEDTELEPKEQGEPFPNASTAGETFIGLPIRPAGVHSQLRQPFVYTVGGDDAPDEQPITDTISQTVSLPTNPPSRGGTSPTYFYTTPFDPSNHSLQFIHHDQAPVHVGALGFPYGGRASALAVAPHHAAAQEQQWEREAIYRSDCISPCYGRDGVCHYCPSRSVVHNLSYNPPFPAQYAFHPPPLTPPVYYPGHIPPPPMMTNMVNVVPTPSPTMLGYEYVDHQIQSAPHTGAWGHDPAIAVVGPGMNAPSPAPFFLREEAPLGRTGGRYSVSYTRPPSVLHATQNQQRLQLEAPQPNATQNIYAPSQFPAPPSTSPSSHSTPLVSTESTPATLQPGGSTHEHNQLNLERIISGMDTRTTVMIKNIPNKMSDSDLEAYIGKVCPHRIDFLYLRMDFKNGCNVGYAFVNFIHVEDLLYFARERLGAKWNMFSSEKVLQMSYANYQGKEALVEKFKNSAIMDERESWRPRIFFSAGPNEGYPEPFPAPTHIRRKERSSYNRGTLFPPGVNSHSMASHSHSTVQNTVRRYHHDDTPRAIPQRGVGVRYQAHAHDREQDDGRSSRRGDRMLNFSTTSNQRATR